MTLARHEALENEFKSFGSMLCKTVSLDSLTYNNIRLDQKCNVIVRYNIPDKPEFAYGEEHINSTWYNNQNAEVKPCDDTDLNLYNLLDEAAQYQSYSERNYAFYVSQAIWTPNDKVIQENMLQKNRPSLYQWTFDQYEPGGHFDKWLRKVKTC